MKTDFLIKGATVVNEGKQQVANVYIANSRIFKISTNLDQQLEPIETINGTGKLLLPGVIDDQVHFREPGLTQKAEIATEAKAAVAGGVTSFMEMPNTIPNALTQKLLQDKYDRAAEVSLANYSFYMGASNNNLDEVLTTNPKDVCGVKVFMGSSTGNMLVDKQATLEGIFGECEMLIATHCEDEQTIRNNTKIFKEKYGHDIPFSAHPKIRNAEACYISSSKAVELATKTGARLHILHLSTAKEMSLFRNDIPLKNKKITAEACVHHLWFDESQYDTKGAFIKWNPAVKSIADRDAIRAAVNSNLIDVIATDHAPHTFKEKSLDYVRAPSGGPLVQHVLLAMLQMVDQGIFTLDKIVEKLCHAPADLFNVVDRGYIREGYYADLVLVNKSDFSVTKSNILYKCGWSPFEGTTFNNTIDSTFVNGILVYNKGNFNEENKGSRLLFNR
jgi:dihydroorotase|tara:strand:- start:769 stop:2109 length:1341 start_codon:yes stop_codon:yes gene_type:complete